MFGRHLALVLARGDVVPGTSRIAAKFKEYLSRPKTAKVSESAASMPQTPTLTVEVPVEDFLPRAFQPEPETLSNRWGGSRPSKKSMGGSRK